MVLKSCIAASMALLLTSVPSALSAAQVPPPSTSLLRWFNLADITKTAWAFGDVNAVGWAQGARAAAELCAIHGVGAGHFNGHQDLSKGTFGVQCSDSDVVWRDTLAQEVSSGEWAFSDVNQVSWAHANRAAERLCATANQGFAGGHFNGHQVGDRFGLFCYRGSAKWFDATDAELAATGWGFATPKLDDVQWAQAMRAATGFCQGKGFEGGFMNGHQAPNKYGVVCQRPLAAAQASAPSDGVQLPAASTTSSQSDPISPDAAADPIPPEAVPAADPIPPEAVPAATRAAMYKTIVRFTDDTCPFTDYRDSRTADITPFAGAGFFLPLYAFGTVFDGAITLQGPANLATAGGGMSYSGPVRVQLALMPSEVPARFNGTLSADGSRFNATFDVNGTCTISGTIEGQRL